MGLTKTAAFLTSVVLTVLACSSAFAQAVSVGGKNFTEQLLIAEMTAQLLRAKGFSVTTRTGFATHGIRREQELGLVDIYWEYTGTSLIEFNKIPEKLPPAEAFERVKSLDAKRDLVWLAPSMVNNTYALAMRSDIAATKQIISISDLAAKIRSGDPLRLASNTEFYFRSDGLIPLQRAYGFEFGPRDVVRMSTDAVYDVLRTSTDADVGLVFATDGRVSAFGLLPLLDDRAFFPSYLLAPVVRRRTLGEHPALAAPLHALAAKLDNPTMARLNAMIDIERRPVEDVASSFLKASGLL